MNGDRFGDMNGALKFLKPDRRKLVLTIAIAAGLMATGLLRLIPRRWDLLDLHDIPGLIAVPLGRVPIALFDWLTQGRFAPKGDGGFLVFPSMAEILFTLSFDVLAIYLIACAVAARLGGKKVPDGL